MSGFNFWLCLALLVSLVYNFILAFCTLAMRGERDELQATFDMQWEADKRGIKKWQGLHPERNLTWPDRANFVVWLLHKLEAAEDQRDRAWASMEQERCDMPPEGWWCAGRLGHPGSCDVHPEKLP